MPERPSIAAGSSVAGILRAGWLDSVDARLLLCQALGFSRIQLITEAEHVLDDAAAARVQDLFVRRWQGEPVAYLLGEREFFGLAFTVTPAVLIPRPETELLVELALARLPAGASVLDLGTGSGAIPVSIAHARADARVTALDVSPAALAVAQTNAQRHAAAVRFLHSDWFAAVAGERFDLLVSNPPYIAAGDQHLSQGDLRFEPPGALTDHADGLAALRILCAQGPAHLNSGGWLLMEHGYDQAPAVRELLTAAGFGDVQSWQDLAGIERVSGGRIS